ncbi:hypothetical protein [Paracoccus jiaweipingae]|uniref:hypothetical protein n=1 Tax=unclassified Paracoccus (in: a-proteobacteria) TaxID=2688777 RepID=UPI003791363B
MPLPQFLMLLASVIMAAAATIWMALKAGVPLAALALVALTGAGIVHLSTRDTRQ